jgi:hypothetical protein
MKRLDRRLDRDIEARCANHGGIRPCTLHVLCDEYLGRTFCTACHALEVGLERVNLSPNRACKSQDLMLQRFYATLSAASCTLRPAEGFY